MSPPPSLGLRPSLAARATLAGIAAAILGAGACTLNTQGVHSEDAAAASSGPTGSGGSGGLGGSGGGVEPICFPGATIPCYDGPEGTEDVGLCKGSQKTCAFDGMTFGACAGQVVPGPEDCVSAKDEDCDGSAGKCTGSPAWSRHMGGSGFDTGVGITTDKFDNVIVVGRFDSMAGFGSGELLTSVGDGDIFIAKYSKTNGLLWNKSFGSAELDAGLAVATDADGNIFVAGQFHNTIDFGLGPFKNEGGDDIFILKLDQQGFLRFAKRFGSDGDQLAYGLAIGADGGPVITGAFSGSVTFDAGAPSLISAGDADIFIAKLGPNGEYQWARRFGDSSKQSAHSVATGADGRIVIAGLTNGSYSFDSIAVGPSSNDAFVAAFNSKGVTLYARAFGDGSDQTASAVAVDGAGNAIVTGDFQGTMVFKSPLTAVGSTDVFVAALSPSGDPLWSKRLGGQGEHHARGVAVDPFGNALIVGHSSGTVSFDMGDKTSATRDILVAKFGPNGNGVWLQLIGDSTAQEQYGLEIAADSKGNVVVTGEFDGSLMFPGVPAITSTGWKDAFVAKLAP